MPSSGFGEESEQEVKDTVKSTGDTYTWEELSKYNERYNAHVAVRGKVSPSSISLLQRILLLVYVLILHRINGRYMF